MLPISLSHSDSYCGPASLLHSVPNYFLHPLRAPLQLWQFLGAVVTVSTVDLGHIGKNTSLPLFLSELLPVQGPQALTQPPLQRPPSEAAVCTVPWNHFSSTADVEACLLNRKRIPLVAYSGTVLPEEHCLGIPKSLIDCVRKLHLSASCYNPSLSRTQTWVHTGWAKRGPCVLAHHPELCPQASLPILGLCKKHLAQNLAHSKYWININHYCYLAKVFLGLLVFTFVRVA